MPTLSWGSIAQADMITNPKNTITRVSDRKEIGKGKYLYIHNEVNEDWSPIDGHTLNELKNGNILTFKNQIESQIQGTKVTYLSVSWVESWDYRLYLIKGLSIVAIVKNVNAGLTGLEITAIIFAVGWISAVLAAIIITTWVVYEIIRVFDNGGGGIPDIPKIATGLVLIVMFLGFILILFGGGIGIEKKGKGGKVSLRGKS